MPIEIRQLVIRAVADATRQTGAEPGAARGAGDDDHHEAHEPGPQADLVAKCVREVMRELRKSRER